LGSAPGEGGETDIAASHRDADLARLGFSRRIREKTIAVLDATRGEGVTFDALGAPPRAAQIEDGGQIRPALDGVLRRRLKPGCLLTFVFACAYTAKKNKWVIRHDRSW
jgi:hypothetical protein